MTKASYSNNWKNSKHLSAAEDLSAAPWQSRAYVSLPELDVSKIIFPLIRLALNVLPLCLQ